MSLGDTAAILVHGDATPGAPNVKTDMNLVLFEKFDFIQIHLQG